MDLSKIKNMVRENGDKVIFMENGEPDLVMMSFAEYEKLARLHLTETPRTQKHKTSVEKTGPEMNSPSDDTAHGTEFMAPMEIAPIRTASIQGIEQFGRGETRMSDVRLEDLPI